MELIEYNKQFQKALSKIGETLNLTPPKRVFKILTQDKKSSDAIPDLGKKFGISYAENGDLILAKWLFDLSSKEQKTLIDFLLTREAFRFYFRTEIGEKSDSYERFTDILLQIITMLWICQQNKLQLTSAPMITIKGRADAFEEVDILKSEYWVYFLTNCFQLNISSTKLFMVVIEQVKDAIKEDKALYDLAWDIYYWLKAHFSEDISYGLPIYIEKKRHYELIKIISENDFNDCTALNLGKVTNRSYNVVNRDFQQIMDKYGLYWWTNIKLLKLRLYPYFFRVNVKKIEQKNQLIKKLKTNRYIRNLKECEIKDKALIVGWLECPLIVYEQQAEYFEKLYKKGVIEEYFIKQVRNKKISWAITNKKIQPTAETYQKLLAEPEKQEYKTIIAIDEDFDITSIKKEKKEIFNDNVLMFSSSLLNRHIGKTHYQFMPLDLFYDLCEKNEIDSTNTAEVTYYISQIDMRCRRLGVYNYYINIRRAYSFNKALYVELLLEPETEKSQLLLNKLNFAGEVETLTFNDRVVLILPEVRYESLFREELEKVLAENNIQYKIDQLNSHQGLRVPTRFLYNEAYDFTTNNWRND